MVRGGAPAPLNRKLGLKPEHFSEVWMMEIEHKAMDVEREKQRGFPQAFRFPCSCGWKGTWFRTVSEASDSWTRHRAYRMMEATNMSEPGPDRSDDLLELRCSSCDWTDEETKDKVLELANKHCFACSGHIVRSYRKGEDTPKTITVFVRKGLYPVQWDQKPSNSIVCSN